MMVRARQHKVLKLVITPWPSQYLGSSWVSRNIRSYHRGGVARVGPDELGRDLPDTRCPVRAVDHPVRPDKGVKVGLRHMRVIQGRAALGNVLGAELQDLKHLCLGNPALGTLV